MDYAFGPHVESRACRLRHRNIAAMRAAVDEHWAAMPRDYVIMTCQAFRRRLEAIVAAGVIMS